MIFWSFQGVQKETSGLKWVTEKESNWFLTCFNKLHKKLFIFKKLSVLSTISTNLSQILYRYSKPSYWCNYYSQFTHTCYNYMASHSTTSCQVQLTLKENPDGPTTTYDITNGARRFEFTNAKSDTTYIATVRAVAANDKVGNWSTPGTIVMRKNYSSYSCS